MSGQLTQSSPLAAEATTALLLGTLADEFSLGLVLAVPCRLTLCGVPLAFIDATVHRLPGVHVIRRASRVTLFLSLTTQSKFVIVSRVMSFTAHFDAGRVGYVTHSCCTSSEERP
jgi:hypothetical protein